MSQFGLTIQIFLLESITQEFSPSEIPFRKQ